MKMVLVQWEDSASAVRGWVGRDESMCTVLCTSLGFVHKRKKRSLVLAQSFHTGQQVGNLIAIPKSAIRKMRKVKRGH